MIKRPEYELPHTFTHERSTVTQEQLDRVIGEFFEDAEVKVSVSMQGQRVHDNGAVILGTKAGPGYSLSNLVHEMAHFVEIDEGRMAEPGWGLRVPEQWAYNRMCFEPTTCQATVREIRVMAFQLNILEYLGWPGDENDLINALQFMPDTAFVPLETGVSAYGDDTPEMPYQDTLKSQQRWRVNECRKYRRQNTADLFCTEWKRRNQLLKERRKRAL